MRKRWGLGNSGPRADDYSDDNGDDSRCLNHVTYTTIPNLSCLVTAPARSSQCGGQECETRRRLDCMPSKAVHDLLGIAMDCFPRMPTVSNDPRRHRSMSCLRQLSTRGTLTLWGR
jgi:hypothetical protein